jgi:hypothetical protein
VEGRSIGGVVGQRAAAAHGQEEKAGKAREHAISMSMSILRDLHAGHILLPRNPALVM